MIVENNFALDVPIEQAWSALNDPERVAPCFPGATLHEYTDNSFTGTVKVKLGPISLTYRGTGTYISRDDDTHTVVIRASGRDSRGNGSADAAVTGSLVADGPQRTQVHMRTDMAVTGRPAQFGRGVMNDVSNNIMRRFADRLGAALTQEQGLTSVPGPTAEVDGSVDAQAPATAPGTALDIGSLFDIAGAPILRRIAPIALGVAVLVLVVRVLHAGRTPES